MFKKLVNPDTRVQQLSSSIKKLELVQKKSLGPTGAAKQLTFSKDQNPEYESDVEEIDNKPVIEKVGKGDSKIQQKDGVFEGNNIERNMNIEIIQSTQADPKETIKQDPKWLHHQPQTGNLVANQWWSFKAGGSKSDVQQKDEDSNKLKNLDNYQLFPSLLEMPLEREHKNTRSYPVRSKSFFSTVTSFNDSTYIESADSLRDTREGRLLITYKTLFWAFFLIFCASLLLGLYFMEPPSRCNWYYYPWCLSSSPHQQASVIAAMDHLTQILSIITIASTSALLLTQCRCTMNWVAENVPVWVDVVDIGAANRNIYWWLGVFFCEVPTVLNVFSAFVPVIDGYGVRLIPEFSRSDNPKQPQFVNPIYDPITNNTRWEIVLAGEDYFRIIGMSILFFLIFPLSMSKALRRFSWSTAVNLHMLGAMWFVSDILLKFWPWSLVFNGPCLIWCLLDQLYGIYVYRTVRKAEIIKKLIIDKNYAVVFLKVDLPAVMNVGDTYWFDIEKPHGFKYRFEHSHPFTAWRNNKRNPYCWPRTLKHQSLDHKGHKFRMIQEESKLCVIRKPTSGAGFNSSSELESSQTYSSDEAEVNQAIINKKRAASWDLAIVMAVQHPSVAQGCFSKNCVKRNMIPWTTKVLEKEVKTLRVHGPYRTGFGVLGLENNSTTPPLILISSGAGVGYMLTFHQWLLANNRPLSNPVHIYYTTNSKNLFQFVTDNICQYHFDNLHVTAHLTRVDKDKSTIEEVSAHLKSRRMVFGRLSLADIIESCPEHTEVFFVGSAVLNKIAQKLCKAKNIRFIGGHVFN